MRERVLDKEGRAGTRAVINGMRYETRTATMVASWMNGYDQDDDCYREEVLYVTERGNWFTLYRHSGFWATVSADEIRISTSVIQPLSADLAYRWLEFHDCPNAIEAYFSDRIEDA
jgi:hypothetical protein